MDGTTQALIVAAATALVALLTKGAASRNKSTTGSRPDPTRFPSPPDQKRPRPKRSGPYLGSTYPGDFAGRIKFTYAPEVNGEPDPGEVVWTWVPYEENAGHGKDRPVLLVGWDGPWLLGLMMTSKDHDRDAANEAQHGRHWLDLGSGPWDSEGRPSEVRLDRVIRVNPQRVRREGAILDHERFDSVARAVSEIRGW